MLNPYERRFYYFCGLVLDSHRMHPWHTSLPFVGVDFGMDHVAWPFDQEAHRGDIVKLKRIRIRYLALWTIG